MIYLIYGEEFFLARRYTSILIKENLFFELREKIAKSIENKGFHEILNKKF